MFKYIKALYKEYRPYVRIDLVMYGVMIVLIISYVIYMVIANNARAH